MDKLIKPKEVEIETEDGPKIFIISRFPSDVGRAIMSKYPLSAMPKVGDYNVNEETMFQLMKYVAVPVANGNEQRLINLDLYRNHIDSWETSLKVEWKMLEYNCSFFRNGSAWTFLNDSLQTLPQWITKISTAFLDVSSPKGKPPSTN